MLEFNNSKAQCRLVLDEVKLLTVKVLVEQLKPVRVSIAEAELDFQAIRSFFDRFS